MKKVQLNNKKYDCPESWDDITVRDQIRVAKITQEYSGLTAQLQLIAGYLNIPVEEIKKTHISKLPVLVGHLKFIQEPLDDKPIESFEFKGHTYYVMPTLINGEFQDFISLESAIKNNEDKSYKALPTMIAILAKRKGETLDDYDLEERSEIFMDLPIQIANSISGFFLNLEKVSQLIIQTSSVEKEVEKEMISRFEELESITSKSDGLGWFGRFRQKILRNHVKSLKKNYLSSLTSTQSKS